MGVYMEYNGTICFETEEGKDAFIAKAMSGGWIDEAEKEEAEHIMETTYDKSMLTDPVLVWSDTENPLLVKDKCVYIASGLQNNIYKLIEFAIRELPVDQNYTNIKDVCLDGDVSLEEYRNGKMHVYSKEDMEKVLGREWETMGADALTRSAYAWLLS